MTANLALAWSTAVTVPCTLTTVPVSTEWRSAATRVVDDEAWPVLGDLGDLIDVADGVRVWRRFYLGPDAGGFPLLVHEPLGSAGAYLRVHAERGTHRAGRYFHSCVFVGVGVGRVLLSDGAPPSSVLPRAKPGLGGLGVVAAVALGPFRVGPPQGRVESLIWPSPGRGR